MQGVRAGRPLAPRDRSIGVVLRPVVVVALREALQAALPRLDAVPYILEAPVSGGQWKYLNILRRYLNASLASSWIDLSVST